MLDGKITINNPNFTMQKDKVNNNFIKDIDVNQNTISLNSIVYGNSVTLEIPIKFKKQEEFETNYFEKEINLLLSGNYKKEEKIETLNSEKQIKLYWTETNADVIFTQDIGRYIDLGENGILLEQNIQTEITNDSLPREKERIALQVPELNGQKPKVAYVILNGERLEEEKIQYRTEDGIVTISGVEEAKKTEDTEETKETYKWGLAKNQYEIIYIYGKEAGIGKTKVRLNSIVSTKLFTKEDIQKLDTKQDIEIEPRGSLVEINEALDGDLYKGYLYANDQKDTEFVETEKIKIVESSLVNNIRIEKIEQNFVGNDSYFDAGKSLIYKGITINKEEFIRILGEDGTISVKNANDEIVAKIDVNSQTDENGNINIKYENEVGNLKIETSKPKQEGEITVKNLIGLKGTTNYNRETIKKITKLEIKTKVSSNISEETLISSIDIKDTNTQARLQINKDSLSTAIANEVEIRAILQSNHPKYDLFKNPVLTINFPQDVEEINIKSINMLYENELKIKNYNVSGKSIYIELDGTQTTYKDSAIEGATIVINGEIKLNPKAITKDENISLVYTNNIDNNQEKSNQEVVQGVKIVAPRDVLLVNSIEDWNVETTGESEVKSVEIERGKEEKQVYSQIEIINNQQEDLKDVKVLGEFPTNNSENNLGVQIIEGIQLTNSTSEVKIYYSNNENATEDVDNPSNNWKENLEEVKDVKKYLILIDTLPQAGTISGKYKIKIPENLKYNQHAKTEYKIVYSNNKARSNNYLASTVVLLDTGLGPEVEVKLTATRKGQEINTPVKNGEVIHYKVEVSNIGTEDATQIEVVGNVPEGTKMVEPMEEFEYSMGEYYQELEDTEYKTTIESLKAGESITKEYEVQVSKSTASGTELKNQIKITYGDVNKTSNELTYTSGKGEITAVVKRLTDTDTLIYPSYPVVYQAVIENISGEEQKNVKVKTDLPDYLEIESLLLVEGIVKGDNIKELTTEEIEYEEEINIGDLAPGEVKAINYYVVFHDDENKIDNIELSVTAITSDKEEHLSNQYVDKVHHYKLEMKKTSPTQNEYVKSGDIIEYEIEVSNLEEGTAGGVEITDIVPSQLTIQKVLLNEEEITYEGNTVYVYCDIEGNSSITIKITAIVNYSAGRLEPEIITNSANAKILGEEVARTNEVSHIIEKDETPVDPEDPDNPDNPDPEEPGDIADGENIISGVAWFDEDKDGRKEETEELLSGITVKLLNVESNNLVKKEDGSTLEVQTNESGIYLLNNIQKGKYVVIFDFDQTQYGLTKYKVEGVPEKESSNAMINTLNINGENVEAISTDIIEISEGNIADINIGLTRLEKYDLKLEKFIRQIVIKNEKGTTVKGFDDVDIAKVELDAKQLNNAEVTIEYVIKIQNLGEVPGYVRNIVDYMPNDLTFNEEDNKDWYMKDNMLYNESLANEQIEPNQTREITLTLTKQMTEDSTGTVINAAEVAEDYNDSGLKDTNSTPGNRVQNENDMGVAQAIISIRTGGVYITIVVIAVLGVLALIAVLIMKKIKKE